jgi:hypothetical protein
MKKWLLVFSLCAAVSVLGACNKQKPPKLDYTEKSQQGVYTTHGLPGDNFVGTPESESKYTGYDSGAQAGSDKDKDKKDTKKGETEEKKKPASESSGSEKNK